MENLRVVLVILLVSVALIGGFLLVPQGINEQSEASASEYFRVHIRANSDAEPDQRVKYAVKDAVVEVLTPYLAQATTKAAAMLAVKNSIELVEQAARGALLENGFSYTAKAGIKTEEFPTRAYNNLVLTGGVYDSLIVTLGAGAGSNWWCVIYPPLCFIGDQPSGVVYQSKLADIINNFFKKSGSFF
ncbi:MAG: stage II sporulation protein R [Firmicutes bacterium]|nr:stage II sporulation protein R [Bacillota bacterium]